LDAEIPSTAAVLLAARFAAEKHSEQRRKGAAAQPYINHLLEVAELVSRTAPDDTALIIAALLHDTVEDVHVTLEDLTRLFGPDVSAVVAELTDDKSLPQSVRKRLQVENAARKSTRAQQVSTADKISNLRGIFDDPPAGWSYSRKREYFDWAKSIVDQFSSVHPLLRSEFERIYSQFDEYVTV